MSDFTRQNQFQECLILAERKQFFLRKELFEGLNSVIYQIKKRPGFPGRFFILMEESNYSPFRS